MRNVRMECQRLFMRRNLISFLCLLVGLYVGLGFAAAR